MSLQVVNDKVFFTMVTIQVETATGTRLVLVIKQ